MSALGALLLAVGAWEGAISVHEWSERHDNYKLAREYCDRVNKPLLRVGMRRSFLEPPSGDVTIDIDPAILQVEGGMQIDERQMPFDDKQFGVCFNEHTLEHLERPEDVIHAVKECVRVADYAIFLCPSPYSLYSNLLNPTHYLRLWFDNERQQIVVTRNAFRTNVGFVFQAKDALIQTPLTNLSSVGQALIVNGVAPAVLIK